jgi:putative membrane protein
MQRTVSDYLLIVFKGMGMGAADIIPGVSGGTIAFITGIYQELINSIKSVNLQGFRILQKKGIRATWKHINGNFLTAVFGGILVSIFSLARLFSWLLLNYQMMVWAFFFGLIIGSAIYVGKKIINWNLFTILMLVSGTCIAWYITIASPATTTEALWFIFITGAIAISAMILPGISGSFILLLMGKYEFILHAVKDVKIAILAVFAAGCVVGLISFSNVIGWLFKKYPNATIAMLTGFMIGSLNKLWPWKKVIEYRLNSHGELLPFIERSIHPQQYVEVYGNDPMLIPIIICMFTGLGIVFLLEYFAKPQKIN